MRANQVTSERAVESLHGQTAMIGIQKTCRAFVFSISSLLLSAELPKHENLVRYKRRAGWGYRGINGRLKRGGIHMGCRGSVERCKHKKRSKRIKT